VRDTINTSPALSAVVDGYQIAVRVQNDCNIIIFKNETDSESSSTTTAADENDIFIYFIYYIVRADSWVVRIRLACVRCRLLCKSLRGRSMQILYRWDWTHVQSIYNNIISALHVPGPVEVEQISFTIISMIPIWLYYIMRSMRCHVHIFYTVHVAIQKLPYNIIVVLYWTEWLAEQCLLRIY